jgi:hypothetical protein
MPSFTRVEFSVGPSLKSRRVVLLLEFPDEVLQQIHKRKSGSEVEAYPAELLFSAAIWSSATTAAINATPITPALWGVFSNGE